MCIGGKHNDPPHKRESKRDPEAWGEGAQLVRTVQCLLTSVDIFLVPFQGILAFQPLPTAVDFAHKPGIPSASLLVLLKTIRQVVGRGCRRNDEDIRHTYRL